MHRKVIDKDEYTDIPYDEVYIIEISEYLIFLFKIVKDD